MNENEWRDPKLKMNIDQQTHVPLSLSLYNLAGMRRLQSHIIIVVELTIINTWSTIFSTFMSIFQAYLQMK